jgi:hypothetical protein
VSANIFTGGFIGHQPDVDNPSGVYGVGPNGLAPFKFVAQVPVPDVVRNDSVLWLDAADLSTITQAGGAVSQWNNKGTLGNFTQGTGALQPTTGANTLNGLNVIDFAADYLTSADAASVYKFMHDGSTFLVCMVAKHDGTDRVYIGNNGTTSSQIGHSYLSGGVNTTITAQVTNGSGTANPISSSVTSAVVNNTFTIHSAIYDPDNGTAANRAEMFFNAGSANKTNTNTASVSSSNPTNALQIGAAGNNTFPLTGSIAEFVIVSGADATESNRIVIRDYLNAKWGVY